MVLKYFYSSVPETAMSRRASAAADTGSLRPVACLRCRQRRSYCSKEKPTCSRCRDSGLACVYEGARKVLINESYLRDLERKVKTFEKSRSALTASNLTTSGEAQKVADEAEEDFEDAEPLLESFTQLSIYKPSTSFQGPASSDAFLRNVSKVTGFGDGDVGLDTASNAYEPGTLPLKRRVFGQNVRLPPLNIARRLFSAQYSFIGPIFAFTESKEEFERILHEAYNGLPDSSDREACLAYAKLLLILALGQLYSVNQWVDFRGPPGFAYFTEALGLLPETHEEGSVLCVETLSMAGYFMQNMNRRDAAFQYIGRALRMAVSLGLHHEVEYIGSTSSNPLQPPGLDDVARERRRRVWWSVYSLDRILCVKSGNPITIQDEDIGVQLPSRLPSEAEYCPAIVFRQYTKLSRILGDIHTKIYRRTNKSETKSGKTLMAAVQKIILSLSEWESELPFELRFDPDRLHIGRESVSTLAHYYQCINMTVRPLLFHIVQKRLSAIRKSQDQSLKEKDWKTALSQTTVSVIEMCIGAAHENINIMAIASQKDLVATYGYMDGEHIFSATIVLVMICAAFPTSAANLAAMNTGLGLLKSMAERGNTQTGLRYERLSRFLSAVIHGGVHAESTLKRPMDVPEPFSTFPLQSTNLLGLHGPTSTVGSGSSVSAANAEPLTFPTIDIRGLAEPFYDESASTGMDFGLWEEGFAYPTMDLDLNLAQQQPLTELDQETTITDTPASTTFL